jgi:hypothetical protein
MEPRFKSSSEYKTQDSLSRRALSESYEMAIDEYINKMEEQNLVSRFFGVNSQSIGSLITEEESKKFMTYFRHVAKRICAAHLARENQGIDDVHKFLEDKLLGYLLHDVSHSVEFADLHKRYDGSVVQDFLKRKVGTSVTSDIIIEEVRQELFNGLFSSTAYLRKPLSLDILGPNITASRARRELEEDPKFSIDSVSYIREIILEALNLDVNDFSNYVYKFIVLQTFSVDFNEEWETQSTKFAIRENESKEDHKKRYDLEISDLVKEINGKLTAYLAIASGEHGEEIIDVLYYVWSNRENPRVLVNLFFILTEDYFKKLDLKYQIKG